MLDIHTYYLPGIIVFCKLHNDASLDRLSHIHTQTYTNKHTFQRTVVFRKLQNDAPVDRLSHIHTYTNTHTFQQTV